MEGPPARERMDYRRAPVLHARTRRCANDDQPIECMRAPDEDDREVHALATSVTRAEEDVDDTRA